MPQKKGNPKLTPLARRLRRDMTKEERKLWFRFLRTYPIHFYRQRIIGGYIVDFYCAKAKLVIELDGSQHYEEDGMAQDSRRTVFLQQYDLLVMRIPNCEVNEHFEEVCEAIDQTVRQRTGETVSFDIQEKPLSQEAYPMKTVELYTDGACSGNPGPGGWAAILLYKGRERVLSGGEEHTTNNRMELTAVIQGLLALKESCVVELYSDSRYVIEALEKGWAWGWRKRGWVKSDKKPALNPDLWAMLLDLCAQHEMHYHWVKGHADNPYNERCDKIAVAEREKYA